MDKQRLRTFLIGGAAGIIAGVLLAPRSGRELRGSISNRAGEARERSREGYFDVGERLRERASRLRDGNFQHSSAGENATPQNSPGPSAGRTPPSSDFPPLRDVSRDTPPGPVVETPAYDIEDIPDEPVLDEALARSEELRRKVRETRERLARSRESGSEGGAEHGSGEDESR